MTIKPLPNETAARTGFSHLAILTHADLTEATANTAQTIALLTVAAGDLVTRVATVLKTPFEDASDNTLNTTTAIIGDDGSTNRFITSQELNVNGSEVLYKGHANTTPYVYTAANTIDIIIGSMAAKSLSNVDTGELHVYIGLTKLATLDSFLS